MRDRRQSRQAARALRRLMIDIRRLASAHPAHAGFRLRCPCSVGGGEFSGAHDDPLPQAAGRVDAAQRGGQIAGAGTRRPPSTATRR